MANSAIADRFAIYPAGRKRNSSKDSRLPVSETERLRMLNEISRALTSRLDPQEVYDTIYERISRVMDTAMFFLALRLPGQDRAQIAYLREFGRLSLDVTTPPGRNVTTHVFSIGQPLLFQTSDQYESYALNHGLPVIILGDESQGSSQSMIFAPLNTGAETIGTLSVQSTREDAYSQHDFDMLTVIASQAAIAVQNARLYEATRESARRHQALIKIAETVNGSLNLSTVLNSILDGIRDVMPYHLAAIMLPDKRGELLHVVGSVGHLAEDRRRSLKVPVGEGVTGKVFETGKPLVLNDVSPSKDYIVGSDETRSEVAVPLKRDYTIVGVLNVERSQTHAFQDDDVELLLLFASQAAIAIENARLFEEQQNRGWQLQTIQGIVRQMTAVHQNEDMTLVMEQGLHALIEFDQCMIYLVQESSGSEPRLEPIASASGPHDTRRLVRGECVAGWIWEHGEATVFDSTHADPRASKAMKDLPEFSVMGAPMMHHDKVTGVIVVARHGSSLYDANDLGILEIFAGHAAIGFDRCRLYEELHLQATTDDLTGLFNRRHLSRRLDEEMSRSARNGHPLAVLLIDADEFKKVNDLHGHDAGDGVLKRLAHLLQTEVRTEDIVARYGGEEFLVVLPEVDADGGVATAERLRHHVVQMADLAPSGGATRISISVGVSMFEPGDKVESIITRADLAMYESKKQGGNRVTLARHSDLPAIASGEDLDTEQPAA